MSGPGDLARRVAERRRVLGLSTAEVARRAGMDPGYLARLEATPASEVSPWGVLRLAVALDTTVEALSGAPPRARGGLGVLEPVDAEECWSLIGDGGVGRVVLESSDGPVALPVRFSVAGRSVRFRTAAGGVITAGLAAGRATVEVDRVDEEMGEGWSVLLTGVAEVRAVAEVSGSPRDGPAVEGHEEVVVELRPDAVSGRRVRRAREEA